MFFYLFIAWPEAISYHQRRFVRRWYSSVVAWQKIKLSSANRRWEIHTPFVQDNTPWRLWACISFLINENNPSTHKKNRYSGNGSPCLIPKNGVTYPWGSPLMSTEQDVTHTVSIARLTQLPSIPNFSIIHQSNSYSTRSYALLMSSLIAIRHFFPILLFLILCNI